MIEDFKEFLVKGNRFDPEWEDDLGSRYYSFKAAIDRLSVLPSPNLLELGTCHSFVNGGLPGCDDPDPAYWHPEDPSRWDWGAGPSRWRSASRASISPPWTSMQRPSPRTGP